MPALAPNPTVIAQGHHGKQSQKRTADGIKQIFQRAQRGLFRPLMEDQRHTGQRRHFKAEIQTHQIGRQTCRGHGAQRSEPESEKLVHPVVVLQILKGVDRRGRIDRQHQDQEKPSHLVQRECQSDIPRQTEQRDRPSQQDRKRAEQIRQHDDSRIERLAQSPGHG